MNRLAAAVISVLLTTSLWLIAAPPARACSCVALDPNRTEEQVIAEYDAVFSGLVTEEHPAERVGGAEGTPAQDAKRYVFQVDRVDKGDAATPQDVFSPPDEASCGSELVVGTPYRVFAREFEGRLHINLCGDTHPSFEPGRYGSNERRIVVPAAPEAPELPEFPDIPPVEPMPLPGAPQPLPFDDEFQQPQSAPLVGIGEDAEDDNSAVGILVGLLAGAGVVALAWQARRRLDFAGSAAETDAGDPTDISPCR